MSAVHDARPRPKWRPILVLLAGAATALGPSVVMSPAQAAPALPQVQPPDVSPASQTPVQQHGQLQVCGNRLCDEHGEQVQLRGMSTHGLQWYGTSATASSGACVNDASLDALAGDWQADVLRISMYVQEDGYETNPRLFTDEVHQIIEMATARGMYAIVDWHTLSPGDPHINLDRARTFFTEIAEQHRDKPNVLYEVANEPHGVTWSRVKSYHEEIIPVIRQQDPNAVILLGTRGWSSLGVSEGANEQEIIDNPVDASNIMYTFHFYAASHDDLYLNTLSRAADQLPVFVTEWGTQTYTGDGGNDFAMSQRYVDLMAEKRISWVNWNWSHDFRSGAVFQTGTCPDGPFVGTSQLKEAGVWIRDRIRDARPTPPPASPTPTASPTTPPASPTPPPASTPPPSSGGCSASYQLGNQWPGRFQGEVTVTNTSSGTANGWQVTMAFPDSQQVSQVWNGSYSQSGDTVTVTNTSWNGTIPPGGSVDFGFLGSFSGANNAPSVGCVLN